MGMELFRVGGGCGLSWEIPVRIPLLNVPIGMTLELDFKLIHRRLGSRLVCSREAI